MNEYKEECMRRFKETQKYQKYDKEDLVDELYEKNQEIERLNNIINELVLSCYGSDMSLAEFENIWKIAFNEKYNPEEIDKLKELKEDK